jgi:hypothetical protein
MSTLVPRGGTQQLAHGKGEPMSSGKGTSTSGRDLDRVEEAAQWWVTLQETELSANLEDAWMRWRAVPENWDAFQRISKLPHAVRAAGRPRVPTQRELDRDGYTGSEPVAEWHDARPEERGRQMNCGREKRRGWAAEIRRTRG